LELDLDETRDRARERVRHAADEPGLSRRPYRFVNREYLIIQYRTDLEALRRVQTPLVEKQISDIAAERKISQKEGLKALLADKQPSLDFVSPAQLGGTVAFLCSAAADQVTGTAISVDGGWTAQ
jgi:NAD(P)-dependent dehydrogenase (short-subunit alcohol dehydrogenase family)